MQLSQSKQKTGIGKATTDARVWAYGGGRASQLAKEDVRTSCHDDASSRQVKAGLHTSRFHLDCL